MGGFVDRWRWLSRGVAGILLLAGGAEAAERPTLVVVGLKGSNTLLQRRAEVLVESILTGLRQAGEVEVVGPRAVEERLGGGRVGAARRDELLGCGAARESCDGLSDLEGTWALVGRLLGGSQPRQLEVLLIRIDTATVVWRDGQGEASELQPPPGVPQLVLRVAEAAGFRAAQAGAHPGLVTDLPPPPDPEEATSRTPAWITLSLGGVATVLGGAFLLDAITPWNNLHSDTWRATRRWNEVAIETSRFNVDAAVGTVALSVGAAGLLAGALWAVLASGPAAPPVTVAPRPGGLVVGVAW